MKKVLIRKNRYVDSVSLMAVSDRLALARGVRNAETQMATPTNIEVLAGLGYALPTDLTPNDLVLAVSADEEAAADGALKLAEDLLDHKNTTVGAHYARLEDIDLEDDYYDLAQISLPGEYVFEQARKAIEVGLDVFIFSDNVPLEEELALKQLGEARGRLVMGPDCGIGLINGVALAAGSIVRQGPVGIVGASGSGAQEVACIVEKAGLGISSIIGTGGHDLYPQIGGLTMLRGIKRLVADPNTKVIVLVSKLADLGVMEHMLQEADQEEKPVVAVFLGSDAALFASHRVHGEFSLEAAALKAVELAGGSVDGFALSDAEIGRIAAIEIGKLRPEQKYFRGLYCGGTFTEESLLYFSRHNAGCVLYSNLENKYAKRLASHTVSKGHTILDLGAEDFTAQAPHPVFDPSLRLKRLGQELEDPEVAVVMLDFITGPGVARDPFTGFAEACAREKAKRPIIFIASICGSMEDPQDVARAHGLLADAGMIVTKSNYQSTRLASAMMLALDKKG